MKAVILLSFILAAAIAAPQKDAEISEIKFDNPGDGNYDFNYKTSDGTSRDEHGEQRQIGEESGQVAKGSFSYVGPDSKTYTVEYTADENGFVPSGDHIPRNKK